jgi:hypothetical protein
MLVFVVQAIPQQSTDNPDRGQTEEATNRRLVFALYPYKAQRYAAAQRVLESLVKSAPDGLKLTNCWVLFTSLRSSNRLITFSRRR